MSRRARLCFPEKSEGEGGKCVFLYSIERENLYRFSVGELF